MSIKSMSWIVVMMLMPLAGAKASQPMTFHTSDHCRGQDCAPIILASGDITHDTFDRFTAHIQSLDEEPSFIAFRSTGGNLGQALKMGMFIRGLGLSTRVAHGSDCFSACVYAFMGGVSRTVDPGARMGVHQFSPESEDIQVTVEDTRQIIEGVSRYTKAMNISEDLGALALMARPDQINLLTHEQARMLGLDNTSPGLAAVGIASARDIRITGASMGSDRQAMFSIRPLPGHPSHVIVLVALSEPGLYPRTLMEKRMQNEAKLMVCPAPSMQLAASRCLFVQASARFIPSGDGVYAAGFSVSARDLARLAADTSHLTLAAGPDGHAPLVSVAVPAAGLPEKILALGSQ